ncbi:MAG: DUF1573 domain-containing protein [Planctomycetia bacterium]|nr:DUF1573 domain-containing protein [Planctomycetia bacterium]
MRIVILAAIALLACLPSPAVRAQEWARKMFQATEHDFGTVARGAKTEFRFELTNIYKEDIHVAQVRSSCGCTTPQITRPTLKTFEKGEIVAVYNTTSFLGSRNAVLTVVIDQPFPAEVQLKVAGYIRSDIVLSPGSVELGTVGHGESSEKRIGIEYAGRNDWKILDVRTTHDYLEVELAEKGRGGGRVSYEMLVRVRAGAPAGYIDEQLTVVTNDSRMTRFPVDVRGKVEAAVNVSPSPLFLGVVAPGEAATKPLVVRGKKPFKITGVKCDDPRFTFDVGEESKTLHLVPVTFQSDEPGKAAAKITIETDLGTGAAPQVSVSAQVAPPKE